MNARMDQVTGWSICHIGQTGRGGTVGKSAGNQTGGDRNIAFIPAVAMRRPPVPTEPADIPASLNRRIGEPTAICRIQA